MAKSTQVSPDLVITITLPEQEASPRTGQIVVKRGELGTIHQFQYIGLDEIMQAIQNEAGRLIAVEENPPPEDVKAPKKPDTAKVLAGKESSPDTTQPTQPELPTAEASTDEPESAEGDDITEETEPEFTDSAE